MHAVWTTFSFLHRRAGRYAGVLPGLTIRRMSAGLSSIRTGRLPDVLHAGLTGRVPGLNRGPPDWRPGH